MGHRIEPAPVPAPGDLLQVLARAQALGFLGPGEVAPHIEHAARFADAWGDAGPSTALDLGSGGGLPGLVLARRWAESEWVLLDANERRTAFLAAAVADLGLTGRVTVMRGRAEDVAHDPTMRARFQLVTARSFGPPAVTAECASGFLTVAGRLIVSEPPDAGGRWDEDGLAVLGMAVGDQRDGCQIVLQGEACPDRYPRRVGIPTKRPLF